MNSAEEKRAKFYKFLDGKPLFRALYSMYTLTLKTLQAVLKLSTQTGQSGAVNKTTLESMAQHDDFQEIKRRKRCISNDTSETNMKLTKSVPISTAIKQTPKVVPTRNFFAPLRTNGMDIETTETENTLPEQEAPRKSGRSPPIVMTFTTKWNSYRKKEMVDYSAMKSHLENNNLLYFTFSQKSVKPIKVAIRHLPPHKPMADISNSFQDLGFNVISVRQLTTNQKPPNEQTHLENIPLLPVTLRINVKSQEIF
jgi:hypothetical protein